MKRNLWNPCHVGLFSKALPRVSPSQSIHLWLRQSPNHARTRAGIAFIEHNVCPGPWKHDAVSLVGPITPTSHFFVRNNLPLPLAATTQGDQWAFEVAGCARPGRLTLGQLKGIATQTVASVLQCSGNGRAFFPRTSLPVGSVRPVCTVDRVRVRDVFEHFGGVVGNPSFLTATGGEEHPRVSIRIRLLWSARCPLAKDSRTACCMGNEWRAHHAGPRWAIALDCARLLWRQ